MPVTLTASWSASVRSAGRAGDVLGLHPSCWIGLVLLLVAVWPANLHAARYPRAQTLVVDSALQGHCAQVLLSGGSGDLPRTCLTSARGLVPALNQSDVADTGTDVRASSPCVVHLDHAFFSCFIVYNHQGVVEGQIYPDREERKALTAIARRTGGRRASLSEKRWTAL